MNGRHYALAESVQAYQLDMRRQLKERPADDEFERERTIRMRALAQIETMRARELAGELLQRAQVMIVLAQAVAETKGQVLAIPSKCSRLLIGQTDHAKVHAVLKQFCTLALRGVSQLNENSFPKPGKNGDISHDYVSRKRRKIRRNRSKSAS
jgi:hypothetical protein